MGFDNPPITWRELERTLSGSAPVGSGASDTFDELGRPVALDEYGEKVGRNFRRTPGTSAPVLSEEAIAAGDLPVSRHRGPYVPPQVRRPDDAVPYAELHVHSSFSFLDGASGPEELIEEAERLGLHGMAITDHDGFYGVARFAEAAEKMKVKTVFGAELSLDLPAPQNGQPDPVGSHLLVLARGEEGYHRLSSAITQAQLAGAEKGKPLYDLHQLAEHAGGHWAILTGCRKGGVRRALAERGPEAAGRAIDELTTLFGRDAVTVELTDHGRPLDSTHNDILAWLAADRGLPVVAAGNVHYATPKRHLLAQAMAAVRANRSLDALDGWLPAAGEAYLRSGAEMRRRFGRYPGAVERSVELADDLAFPLRLAKPALPTLEVPKGFTPMTWLSHLVWSAIPEKMPNLSVAEGIRIEQELKVIETKDFPGYFLIVHDIVAEARRRGILCQGRGSAANSAVCYLLGITAVDSIRYDLPFERFLSSLRDEEPDIDVDFDSDRREEIIQYVYIKYGRDRAAQVCNVIQYRPKNAVRDMAGALGFGPGQQDAFSRQIERWGSIGDDTDIPDQVVGLASELLKAPRHLGIHSGGMVLTQRPVGEVVPIEHARMVDRTVIQWDKDDAAWMGLVKFDLLGLGILAALQHTFDLAEGATGERWELSTIPKEEQAVYDMLCRADSIGVFQVESRAQMGLLPRLQPRCFYDLVVQIALIRPGPIQGGAVHPFVRRKLGHETVTYPHPKLEPALKRTLGVPVFQEQLMQMAMAIGDCTGEDADLLRRAMGSKRGIERIESLKEKLYAGMARNGLTGKAADGIYQQIQAFANFGFAESHSLSFALLVYASSWLKLHYPAAFLAGLLRAQPMGFYSSATLTADARRHGVRVLRPCLERSGVDAVLEALPPGEGEPGAGRSGPTGLDACLQVSQPKFGEFKPKDPDESALHRRDGNVAVRLGLAGVRGIGGDIAEKIVDARAQSPFVSMEDLARRGGLKAVQLEALAASGALECLGLTRREALWKAGSAAQDQERFLPGTVVAVQPPLFGEPTRLETLVDDLWATSISTDDHPVAHLRTALTDRGVLTSAALRTAGPGSRIEVAGMVTHRQRPSTASGITFMNLEDEHGLVNVVCSMGVWARYRRIARDSPAVIVRGILERSPEGVANVVADRFEPLRLKVPHTSRDFR